MFISIINENEIENEIDICWACCFNCTNLINRWSQKQYDYVKKHIDDQVALSVPSSVNTDTKFNEYIKSLSF